MSNNLFKKISPHHDAIRRAPPDRKAAYERLESPVSDTKNLNTISDNIGIGAKGSILDAPIKRIQAENETIVATGKNSFIVLGKDREHIRNSGTYALSGNLDTNSIDLCVGLGYNPDSEVQNNKYLKPISPDFVHDKARVYVSEGIDVDKAFGIKKYVKSRFSTTDEQHLLSAVVTKADTIRVLGRTGVKIIAGSILDTDSSQSAVSLGGVELIATDGGDLQPMVLGNNLASALNDIIEHINKLNVRFTSYLLQQMVWDIKVAQHVHLNPFPNTPDPVLGLGIFEKIVKNVDTMTKLEMDKMINTAITKTKFKSLSANSILSSYHKLN